MNKRNFSIRKKLILSYVALLFICVLLYSIFNYRSSRQHLKAEKILTHTNSATSVCQDIEAELHNYSVFSTVVSSNMSIQGYLYNPPDDILEQHNIVRETIEPLLDTFKTLNPSILELKLYTKSSENMIRADCMQYMAPEQMEMITSYGKEHQWEFVNNTFIQRTPIFHYYGSMTKPVGFFEIVVDAPYVFQTIFSDNKNGLQIDVVTSDAQKVWSNVELQDLNYKKEKMVPITCVPINNTSLEVNFSIPAEQFYNDINYSSISNTLLLMAICLICSGIFITLYSRVINKNIRTLTGIIDNIDQSNLDINIDIQQSDEISVLADCLNGMLKRINLLIADIYEVKETEKQMELDALRTQINPHFLYNIMDVINWMAIAEEPEAICNVTGLVSKYYRTMLNHGEFYTTFLEELNNIESYISLQLIMHANSFDVQYDYDESLLEYKVPNFILQPAVENAIKHGIDPLSARRGILRIVLREREGCIVVDICDNGVGFTEEKQQLLNEMLLEDSVHAGYGLHNVQRRIQLAFGTEYGLTLIGKVDEGCIARFRLPLILDEEKIKKENYAL